MRREVHPHTTTKIITALDIAATLAVEQVGVTFNLPAFHPVIVGSVAGATYVLLKHGNTISSHILDISDHAAEAFKKYPLSGN
jgi:hypothetical protein